MARVRSSRGLAVGALLVALAGVSGAVQAREAGSRETSSSVPVAPTLTEAERTVAEDVARRGLAGAGSAKAVRVSGAAWVASLEDPAGTLGERVSDVRGRTLLLVEVAGEVNTGLIHVPPDTTLPAMDRAIFVVDATSGQQISMQIFSSQRTPNLGIAGFGAPTRVLPAP